MICPKCKADTRVKDSRPHADDPTVIRRRRQCDGCGHRFETQEGTVDIVGTRAAKRARAIRFRSRLGTEKYREMKVGWRLRKAAAAEAAETGQPVAEILARWNGVAAPSRPASPHP
ncbi:transcriptional regulator NrdR family protein [Methylorubrum rhodesianum]|uniref:NrdR family transcriptional regulator n=1 Tax=Methylorubrum rhodesianum TaxID=29427 RepID=UPI00161F1A11|nr:hypothetical protein [Methylorubrum rhodesianum]MBB5762138.1 transcriptional regulator NrdR family protein [Methylorubrum rhodesianum]